MALGSHGQEAEAMAGVGCLDAFTQRILDFAVVAAEFCIAG